MMTILSLSTCIVNCHSILKIAHSCVLARGSFTSDWQNVVCLSGPTQSIMSLKSATFSVFCWAALSIIDLVCVLRSITFFNSINVCFIKGA